MEVLPKKNIAEFVFTLAKQTNCSYESTALDKLGEKFIDLDDGSRHLDRTEELLLALTRKKIITTCQMLELLKIYLLEKRS